MKAGESIKARAWLVTRLRDERQNLPSVNTQNRPVIDT